METYNFCNMQQKIDNSIALIRKGERLALALNPTDGYFVGFSGGKDSQVLLQLVKMAGVQYRAYYSVTTNDPPDNVYFIRQHYPDVTFLHPKDNFFKLIEKKGLPTIWHRFCCAYLKENTGAGNAVLTGVRAEESRKRSQYPIINIHSRRKEHKDRRGRSLAEIEANQHRCIKGKDKLMIYPLLYWKEYEVWQFIKDMKLPINPCYERGGRVGCMFCPYSKPSQIAYYENQYPLFKENIIKSLSIYLQKYPRRNDKSGLNDAEEYYEWWKSKKPLSIYLANKRQQDINFN